MVPQVIDFRFVAGFNRLSPLVSRIHGSNALSVCRRCGSRHSRSGGLAKPLVARARNHLTAWVGKAVAVAG